MINIEINGKTYKVELAQTEEEKEKGLMGVRELPKDEGMLFDYNEPQQVSFWMKDTPLALDIIFINEYGEVLSVQEGKPNDETPIIEDNVCYVLELNAGSGISQSDDVDLSELDGDYPDEEVTQESPNKMQVLSENGETQMELNGGERIFSRIHTRKLISLAKKAAKSKKDADYKKLGKKVFEFIDKQNTQKQQFTNLDKQEKPE